VDFHGRIFVLRSVACRGNQIVSEITKNVRPFSIQLATRLQSIFRRRLLLVVSSALLLLGVILSAGRCVMVSRH
jgi:hypothetical protein